MLEVPASVTQVLEQIDAKMPYLTAAPGFADNMLPAAALKRARRLVDALVAVHKAGVGDTGGLVARAIWECWIVGLYLVLDGDKAHEHLLGAWRRQQRKLSENWPGGPPPDSVRIEDFIEAAEADLNFADIAKAVHKLMNQDGRESTMIGSTYDSLYRSYSGYDAHITLGVLYRYLDDKDGVRLELKEAGSLQPPEAEIRLSAIFVGQLACYVFNAGSIGTANLLAWLQVLTDEPLHQPLP